MSIEIQSAFQYLLGIQVFSANLECIAFGLARFFHKLMNEMSDIIQ